MSQIIALAAPWLTLANIFAVASLFIFVGTKLSVLHRLVLDQIKADQRASRHSGEISSNDRRIVVLETLMERSKDLPVQVARLIVLMERVEDRG